MIKKIEEIYVACWCVVMPVTGTVLLPSVQGTIPAYMLALASILLVLFKVHDLKIPAAVIGYFKVAIYVLLLWLVLFAGSQLGLMTSDRHDFGDVNMVDPEDTSILFRHTLFTQSLYLLACVMIALYFHFFFQERWMRYVLWGGYFLAGYGIYEWLFYLIFHQPGDFLVNRSFGEEEHTASWSQGIMFGGMALLRIKSTLGEPTFFAAVVIPYFFLAVDRKKIVLAAMLLFTAVFSTSTACYIALTTCLFVKTFWTGKVRWDYLSLFGIVAIFLVGIAFSFPDTFRSLFADKFDGENESGQTRIEGMTAITNLLSTYTVPNWIFGIGFGYAYLGIYYELLVNTGMLGLGAFLWVFIKPVWLLPIQAGCEGLKMGLLGILLLCGLSLSELFLPTTWMFLGMAYYKLQEHRRAQSTPEGARA